jgi:hypothetical protein
MTSAILDILALIACSSAAFMLGKTHTLKTFGKKCLILMELGKKAMDDAKDAPPSRAKLELMVRVDATMDAVIYLFGIRDNPVPLTAKVALLDDSVSSNP